MIGRGFRRETATEDDDVRGFDAFDLRLGDLMRGERATMGKSLLDVQRELKIKAAYIAAIENCDPTAFDTPGFIAGYVRSYARYLGMDPDQAFATFCAESGFATAHGMSSAASSVKPVKVERKVPAGERNMFVTPATPFIPAKDALFSGFEPRAIGAVAVLLALIAGLGFGGWTILQEVQKVQVAPVEQSPVVASSVDPLAGAGQPVIAGMDELAALPGPTAEALDRLYRPQALDVPVLVARDGPISGLDPSAIGALAPSVRQLTAQANLEGQPGSAVSSDIAALIGPLVQVTETPTPELQLVAVRPAWVRVNGPDGSVLFEGILDAGQSYDVPATEDPSTLRVGESGALYFAVNGEHYGPVGPRGVVTSDVALSVEALTTTFDVADLEQDVDLARIVNVAEAQIEAEEAQ